MPVRALARVNLAAIERNVAALRRPLSPDAHLCAVVKGDGYGHGAVPAARAALAGGAEWLAVATAAEAAELRAAPLAGALLVMGALSAEELEVAVAADADVVAWSEPFVRAVAAVAGHRTVGVHVKLDTGMGRLGTRDRDEALRVVELIEATDGVALHGAMTHFATADGDRDFMGRQLELFAPFAEELRRDVPGIVVHAANSAATLVEPDSHFDLVRCGIAIYGCDPMNQDPDAHGLEPALELTSYVAAVKPAHPGDSTGYGRTFVTEREATIGTLPIGYADGVRRALSNNGSVLIGGHRYPIVGNVSMDNITVDLGPSAAVGIGETGTIIGSHGDQRQTAEDLARAIGTINYEITCGITRRVPREYHRDGEPVDP
jgi:alanine racemase